MRRAGNLYLKIAEMENLRLAFWKAQKGKSSRPDVISFRERLEEELLDLRHGLLEGDVSIGDYRYFTVHDPKERVICAASFRERVLHHAVMNVCEPVFERYQIYDSYACRKGKGLDVCLKRMQEFCRRYNWYLKLDIHKYFDSIDHCILKELLAHHFKEHALLELFGRIIDSYDVVENRGIPIGNLTSQHFANMYMAVFDHQAKDAWRLPGYVRYMDDFAFFYNDRGETPQWLDMSRRFLEERLGLELNEPQSNSTSRGLPAFSYRVYGCRLRLSLKAKRRFKKSIDEAVANGETQRIRPLLAFIDRAEAEGFKSRIFG
ncbi:MAG: RNA-directed DNA polymerase [Victivallales bacterium]|nr:RNA-directed DNA polymerase [Victivallales bacterium]